MKVYLSAVTLFLLLCQSPLAMAKTYLFILSGQSNMAAMKEDESFVPTVKAALEPNEVIVVKFAKSGQPIMKWDENWEIGSGREPGKVNQRGKFYTVLMEEVNKAIEGKTIDCVTFVWMQGEKDAQTNNDDVYEQSFKRLVQKLETDLGKTDINVVYGRLSDYNPGEDTSASWQHMRELQVAMAEANPHWEWVDTDDLNGINNGLHYMGGYTTFGERLAEKSLKLIQENCGWTEVPATPAPQAEPTKETE